MYILSFSVYMYIICMVYIYIYIYIPKFLKIRSDILVRYVMKSYEVAKNH